jgi:hypothetical protein
MSLPSAPTILANAVTGFAVIFCGGLTLALTYLVAPQPTRWRIAYAGILVTGIPTVWFHGFGEQFWPRVADVGTNFLLGWLLMLAALGDYYSARTRWIVGGVALLVNVAVIADMIATGAPNTKLVTLGAGTGYSIRQVTLVADSLAATILLFLRFARIPPRARSLLIIQTVWFLGGAWLASHGNHAVDATVLAYHATWHLVASFGFLLLWAFNHVRFTPAERPPR